MASPALLTWSLPIRVVPAGTVEPGDLLLGPALGAATRIWWRLDDAGTNTVTVLLAGPPGDAPRPLRLPVQASLLITARDLLLPRTEQAQRVLHAAAGGLWLRTQRHTQAPDLADIRVLLDAYARLTSVTPADALVRVRAHLPS